MDYKSYFSASVPGIVLSLVLLANPLFTGLSLSILTALTFVFIGISSIMLSLNLKKIKDDPQKISARIGSRIEQLQTEIEQEIRK